MSYWILTILLCVTTVVTAGDLYSPRELTSANGKRKIVATVRGYDSGAQVLHVRDSRKKEHRLALANLSVQDRLFVLDHKKELQEMFRLMKMPHFIKARFAASTREKMLQRHDFAAGSEAALDKFLQWLKATQNADGSWLQSKKPAMTSLALLTYFGRGETPNSLEYGDTINNAILYLIRVAVLQNGRLTTDLKDQHWPYEHAICTMALAEAQTICSALNIDIPRLKTATKAAGDWILERQHPSGGWDYAYAMTSNRGGDMSISMWQVQALAACKLTGLWKDKDFKGTIRKSIDYIDKLQHSSGGIGYSSPNPGAAGFTLTGAGMFGCQMWGKAHSAIVRKGARHLRKQAKFDYNSTHADLYQQYYNALAMIHRGGEDWKFYNKLLGNQLIVNQNADGSWKDVGGGAKVNAVAPRFQGGTPFATHYRSCLCALILQTPYRYQAYPLAVRRGVQPGQPFGR